METSNKQKQFIQLRGKDRTLKQISKRLNIPVLTLKKWEQKFKKRIFNYKCLRPCYEIVKQMPIVKEYIKGELEKNLDIRLVDVKGLYKNGALGKGARRTGSIFFDKKIRKWVIEIPDNCFDVEWTLLHEVTHLIEVASTGAFLEDEYGTNFQILFTAICRQFYALYYSTELNDIISIEDKSNRMQEFRKKIRELLKQRTVEIRVVRLESSGMKRLKKKRTYES